MQGQYIPLSSNEICEILHEMLECVIVMNLWVSLLDIQFFYMNKPNIEVKLDQQKRA